MRQYRHNLVIVSTARDIGSVGVLEPDSALNSCAELGGC